MSFYLVEKIAYLLILSEKEFCIKIKSVFADEAFHNKYLTQAKKKSFICFKNKTKIAFKKKLDQ